MDCATHDQVSPVTDGLHDGVGIAGEAGGVVVGNLRFSSPSVGGRCLPTVKGTDLPWASATVSSGVSDLAMDRSCLVGATKMSPYHGLAPEPSGRRWKSQCHAM